MRIVSERDSEISDRTSIKLGMVLVSIPVLVTALLWIGSLNDKANANSSRLDRNEKVIETMREDITIIKGTVIRIDERLNGRKDR
jgi:hypothetical protein